MFVYIWIYIFIYIYKCIESWKGTQQSINSSYHLPEEWDERGGRNEEVFFMFLYRLESEHKIVDQIEGTTTQSLRMWFSPCALCEGQFDQTWYVLCFSQLSAQRTHGSIQEVCITLGTPMPSILTGLFFPFHISFLFLQGPLCCLRPH